MSKLEPLSEKNVFEMGSYGSTHASNRDSRQTFGKRETAFKWKDRTVSYHFLSRILQSYFFWVAILHKYIYI